MSLTKEQTRAALEATVRACYYGATRRGRVEWCMRQADPAVGVRESASLVSNLLSAKLMEDHGSYGWLSVTPLLISILDNWDSLTQDMPWEDTNADEETGKDVD